MVMWGVYITVHACVVCVVTVYAPYREAEADDVNASFEQVVRHLGGQAGITQHHRGDSVVPGARGGAIHVMYGVSSVLSAACR